jgi:PAS domain-containing protein
MARTFLEITHPDDAAASLDQVKSLARDEIDQYQIDKRYIRKDGETVWVRLWVRLMKDAQGKSLYFLPMMEDITAHKQAEEAFRKSESQYRLLVNQIPALVFKGYADWSIDFFDDKIEALTGYSKEEFDSRELKWCDLVLPEDLDMVRRIFIEAVKCDKSYVREYRIKKKKARFAGFKAGGRSSATPPARLIISAACYSTLPSARPWRPSSCKLKSWKRWDGSLAAWPTTSTIS